MQEISSKPAKYFKGQPGVVNRSYDRLTHMPIILSKYFKGRDEIHRSPVTGKPLITAEMNAMFGSTRYHSTKQMPSCLTLRGAGARSLNAAEPLTALLQVGFPLEGLKDGRMEYIHYNRQDRVEVIDNDDGSTTLSRISAEVVKTLEVEDFSVEGSGQRWDKSHDDSMDTVDVDPNLAQLILDEYDYVRPVCDDFFETIRAKALADELGVTPPRIIEWEGDLIRLQDPLPMWLLRRGGYTGKRPIEFSRIEDRALREFVIFEHTFWGKMISRLCDGIDCSREEQLFGRNMRARISRFISGGVDPEFSGPDRLMLESAPGGHSLQRRSDRLIECLKTVDGIFIQRFLADPLEVWTWKRYDMFTLGNLWCLITDEFLDGELTELSLSLISNYSALKGLRKFIKLQGHLGRTDLMPGSGLLSHPWLHQFRFPTERLNRLKGDVRIQVLAILSQTRGAGTPPPIVTLQSKAKCLKLLSTAPDPYPKDNWVLVRLAMDSLMNEVSDESLTGLATAARVRVTSNACYEHAVKEGGTLEAVNNMVFLGKAGRGVWRLDLSTGERLDFRKFDDLTVGEYIFWRCLEEVLSLPPEDLRILRLVMVAEPGKARAVTMGLACLKIVLDVIHRLMAKPFAKAFPSSTSGMEKSNHGWNVFREFFNGPLSTLTFSVMDEKRYETRDTTVRDIAWHDVFCSSTDWNTATDVMRHDVASYLSERMMTKMGIPPLLRGIVHETCFKPRKLEFAARGGLEFVGDPASEGFRSIQVLRGVMMGDPLTKLLLHTWNMCTRRIAVMLSNVSTMQVSNAVELSSAIASLTPASNRRGLRGKH